MNAVLIREIFDPFTAAHICSIPIPKAKVGDKLVWTLTAHGNYTSQSFQKLLYECSGESSYLNDNSFPWRKFWGIKKLPPKVHMFIWRVLHNGLGTLHKLGRIIDGIPVECQLCGNNEETIDHLLTHCQFAKAVLFGSPLNFRGLADPSSTTKQCILSWLDAHDDGYSVCLGACLLWAIWKARNKLHFDNIKPHIPSVINDAVHWFTMYYFAEEDAGNSALDIVVNNYAQSTWCTPPEGTVKINVDAAVGLNKTSAAAVARTHDGQFVAASTKISEYFHPLVAEAKGFLLGLQLARSIQRHIIIEGDCLNVVNVLNNVSSFTPWRIRYLVEDIIHLARHFSSVNYKFVKRGANDAAHNLASYALEHNVQQEWTSSQIPACISSCISAELVNH
ncbi:uncharacterized protein LOC113311988 [Papaver somniferum]|uniref:uncharacterized protein LOC113311988 n=1 Tax=Papaver somniferum TaxID=3469 RepID=UPI000E6FD70B|nr:uncharacterized protein LOC113311988 [Papaver somniferum]